MLPSELASIVQAHVARVTLGPSALRSQGPGIAEKARPFFASLDLSKFSVQSEALFRRRLNAGTEALLRSFPAGSGSWGLARKLINIFLREALYNRYSCDRFQLLEAERLYEIPLDSITSTRILQVEGVALPAWPGVKHLTPKISAMFQARALEHAVAQGVARVHLDAMWWGGSRADHAA